MARRDECSSCGHVNMNAKFCERCGQQLAVVMNPYAPPGADDVGPGVAGEHRLASRGARLGASIIDTICVALINVPLLSAAGLIAFDGTQLPLSRTVLAAGLGFIVFVVVQGFFLLHGQTLGKRLLGLRMVDVETGEPAPFGRLLTLRYLPASILSLVPIAGPVILLVDALLIFRSDRRCFHDMLASTRVVDDR